MKNYFRKVFSILMALILVVSIIPYSGICSAFAEDDTGIIIDPDSAEAETDYEKENGYMSQKLEDLQRQEERINIPSVCETLLPPLDEPGTEVTRSDVCGAVIGKIDDCLDGLSGDNLREILENAGFESVEDIEEELNYYLDYAAEENVLEPVLETIMATYPNLDIFFEDGESYAMVQSEEYIDEHFVEDVNFSLKNSLQAIKDVVVAVIQLVIEFIIDPLIDLFDPVNIDVKINGVGYQLFSSTSGKCEARVVSVDKRIEALRIPSVIQAQKVDEDMNPAIDNKGNPIYGSYTVTELDKNLFNGTDVQNLLLPDTIQEIQGALLGNGVFSNSDLVSVTFCENGLKKIGSYAFSNCKNLKNVYLGNQLTTIGNCAFSGCGQLRYSYEFTDATEISGKDIPYTPFEFPTTLKSIGEEAFKDCTNLGKNKQDAFVAISIPNSVDSIGQYAFKNCKSISEITLPNQLKTISSSMFYGCTALCQISIPSSVTEIKDYAFYDACNLVNVTIPSGGSLREIGEQAFGKCDKLNLANTLPSTLKKIGTGAFYKSGLTSISIPNSVTSVNESAFEECTGLETVVIGSGLTEIDKFTFKKCTALSSVDLNGAQALGEIGEEAFCYCSNLTSIKFNSNVKRVNESAFMNCTGLSSVSLNENLKTIFAHAFQNCNQLPSITIPNSVTTINDYAFFGCAELSSAKIGNGVTNIGKHCFDECKVLSNLTVGSAVQTIGDYAFGECPELENVALPATLKNLGASAFYGDINLSSVSFSQSCSLSSIGDWTFGLCEKLSAINIPASVSSIGISAFRYCAEMEEMEMSSTAIESIGAGAFNGCKKLKTVSYSSLLRKIGNRAFYNCPELSDVILPNGVTTIGAQAYTYDTAISEVYLPDSVTQISTSLTFIDCDNLETVYIGNQICKINPYMFYGCEVLDNVSIGTSVEVVGTYAFGQCEALTEIDLSKSDALVEDYVFWGCSSLKNILIGNDNTHHSTENGILYNKDKTTLLVCPAAKTGDVVLPVSLKDIAPYAFYNSGVTNVTYQSSLETVDTYAFANCARLNHFEISEGQTNNIRQIGAFAFYLCTNVQGNPIGKKTESIGKYAFYKCQKLFDGYTVAIPSAVEKIESMTFYRCRALNSIIIRPGTGVIANDAFNDHSADLVIYGNDGSAAQSFAVNKNIPFEIITDKELTGNVLVYGNPGVGRTLSAVLESSNENSAYTCTWYRNGVQCGIGEKYTVAQEDLAQTITVRLTGTDGYIGELESEPIFINGPYTEPVLSINQDSGVELRTIGLTDYIIGVRPWQLPESYASVTDGSIEEEFPKTGGYLRLMKENCIVAEYMIIVFGDVNMDGEVSSEDISLIHSYMDGEESLTVIQKLAADVDGNSIINSEDLEKIDATDLTIVHVNYTGAYTGVQDVRIGNYVTLPVCTQKGYHYLFFCDYDPFDGKTPLTKDIEVSVVLEENIEIIGESSQLHTGSTLQLTAQLAVSKMPIDVLWQSSNPYSVSVDENGVVTANKFGKATISAQDSIGRKAYYTISVTDDEVRLIIRPIGETETEIGLFKSYSDIETYLDYSAYNCTDAVRFEWTSNNRNVQVKNGVVTHTGNCCRTAQITLTAYDASDRVVAKDSIEIRVYKNKKIADFLHKLFGWLGF